MSKLKALIAGSTGYIGIQLIKLLLKHNNIKIKFLCGNSSVGKSLSYYDKSLKKYQLPKIKKFKREFLKDVDVIKAMKTKFGDAKTFQAVKQSLNKTKEAVISNAGEIKDKLDNIINKSSRNKITRGRKIKVRGYKKAIITLKKGQTIDLTTGI